MEAADFRHFAKDCERWAARAANPSHRQVLLDMARTWNQVAMAVERRMSLIDELDQVRETRRLRRLLD